MNSLTRMYMFGYFFCFSWDCSYTDFMLLLLWVTLRKENRECFPHVSMCLIRQSTLPVSLACNYLYKHGQRSIKFSLVQFFFKSMQFWIKSSFFTCFLTLQALTTPPTPDKHSYSRSLLSDALSSVARRALLRATTQTRMGKTKNSI